MNFSRSNLMFLGAGLLVGAGIGVLILNAFGLGGEILPGLFNSSTEPITAPVVNAPAPDFELATLAGEPVRLSDFKGRPVLINFWATWCLPCREEMPLIMKYYQRYQPDLVVLAINNDEPVKDVKAYANKLGLTFPILLDPGGKVEKVYRVRGYPMTFFVNANGMIRYEHIGQLREGQLVQYLEQVGVGQ